MKKITGICVVVALLGLSHISHAQTKLEAVNDVKKESRKASNRNTDLVSKTTTRLGNQLTEMVGPNGEAIYIDRHAKYYWIDEKGTRHYVTKDKLKEKEKPANDDWLKDGMRYV
jgi:hypothetical protein